MSARVYLVTGAAGFLGSNICRQLIERGEQVRGLVLKGDKAARYIPEEVDVYDGDLCKIESLDEFFDVREDSERIVIHCASMVTVDPGFSQKLLDINVGGTDNIIKKCLEQKTLTKLVYVSSTGAIPERPKGEKIREVYEFDPDKVVGWYSRSKAMATQAVLEAVKRQDLNACVVHPSGILGPNDFAVSETTGTVIRIINGEMPVGMQGSFNLCDVRDLAYGCIMAADKGKTGRCYILGNEEVTLKELCQMISDECGSKMIKFYLPLAVADTMAKVLEKRAKKTGKKPLMTTFSVYNLARNNAFDYSNATKELGYMTRSYSETIRDEVAWLKMEGKIRVS